jgi:DNA-binding MarR family transcriptional regulator
VERRPCPRDGRYTMAVLTGAGWQKVVDSAPAHVEAVRTLVLDALTTEELEQLGAMARRILARLEGGDSRTAFAR